MKTTVVHHSADYDGLFCREIAHKFLPDAELIGWDFADAPIELSKMDGMLYVLDLPMDKPFGSKSPRAGWASGDPQVVWIDHHKSAIETHDPKIPGYRIDGVAACRLAWQWFTTVDGNTPRTGAEIGIPIRPAGVLPMIQDYKNREVNEPLAVRLAGEYDIWDKRDPDADTFQYALRAAALTPELWERLLRNVAASENAVAELLPAGKAAQRYQQKTDSDLINYRSYLTEWEGLKFLTLNTARCNSLTFAAKDVPETGHDALLAYYFSGKKWTVSLYHASHRKDIDLSAIAVKYGGGGHKGACGFTCDYPPFLPDPRF